LRVDGKVIGTLAIYSAEAFAIDAEEEKLLTELADDLAFGIANLRASIEQKRIQGAMRHLSRHDVLTGLPNEAQFVDLLAEAIEIGALTGKPFALLQTNIERLNEINDALGFSHGDQLLQEFGIRLKSAASTDAIAARLRGDEFAILMPGQGLTEALSQIQRVADVLKEPFQIADIPLDVSVKIGVALYPGHGSTPHELLRHVDIALNHAKKKGVMHSVFSPEQDRGQSGQLAVAGELRQAIENGDLLLYLQPKVEIATGKVCGAEGLVRWKHAERGLIPPSEFIGLAEHTGLIGPLTEWVIETGLRLNRTWAVQGCALPIALNLSARNLRDENLLQKIRKLKTVWDGAP
jgi:diguanylate cyclase (GGDEF)-like protein